VQMRNVAHADDANASKEDGRTMDDQARTQVPFMRAYIVWLCSAELFPTQSGRARQLLPLMKRWRSSARKRLELT
jgi:hypothetical protein